MNKHDKCFRGEVGKYQFFMVEKCATPGAMEN